MFPNGLDERCLVIVYFPFNVLPIGNIELLFRLSLFILNILILCEFTKKLTTHKIFLYFDGGHSPKFIFFSYFYLFYDIIVQSLLTFPIIFCKFEIYIKFTYNNYCILCSMRKRIILINGSPRTNGNTMAALKEISSVFNDLGIEVKIVGIGKQAMQGCIACGWCERMGRCTFHDNVYDELFDLMKEGFDALVLASPVYFGGPNGTLCALMDRVCYSLKRFMQFKPATAIAVCRRGGASAALERMNNYFSMTNMPIASSQYINIIYGHTPGQVAQDEEGLQTMRTLAKNIAWMINKLNDDEHPELERPVRTSFVR